MDNAEILETRGNFRAVLIRDEYPETPDGDFYPPTLQVGRYDTATHMLLGSHRPTNADRDAERAAIRFGAHSGMPKLEKYLRAYLGATKVDVWYSGAYTYVAYDTPEWREFVGLDHGLADSAEDFLADVKAWVEGEVYAYRIDQRVTGVRVYDNGREVPFEEWEEVESGNDLYGYENARDEALAALPTEVIK